MRDGTCADPSCPIQGEHDHGLLRESQPIPMTEVWLCEIDDVYVLKGSTCPGCGQNWAVERAERAKQQRDAYRKVAQKYAFRCGCTLPNDDRGKQPTCVICAELDALEKNQ